MKTKVFKASCKNKQVTINGTQVPGALIASAGVAESEGFLIFCGPDAVYVAVPVESMKQIITLTADLADKVASGVLASNAGGNITSPTFSAELTQIKNQFEKLKEALQ